VANIRSRYCARWDEKPAADLGISLLRLGICRPDDWTGSAVDFVERGFKRFCKLNGAEEARKIWEGDLRIMDQVFDLTEPERNQAQTETDGPPQTLFLTADFSAAASIPIGAALAHLKREHDLLPAAFYRLFVHHLWRWMRVYSVTDALDHAEMGMIDADEEGLRESCYPKVKTEIPICLRNRLKMSPSRAWRLLKEIRPQLRSDASRKLVDRLLEMHRHSAGYTHAWPHKSMQQIPGLEEHLENCDGLGPGCMISWYEDDAISACFHEEMSYMGQNGPLEPSLLLAIPLDQPRSRLDRQVRRVLNYAGAMLRSLAATAKIVAIIRELYDEHLREHRIKSGLQIEPGTSGVRNE
jgi:hypothetical protein